MTLIVAVTGGIGSGKTTAAAMFQERGADVLDTDTIAHELTQAGRPELARIVDHFGAEYLAADGNLNRAKLRARVFSDAAARRSLEAILHPAIRREVDKYVRTLSSPYALLLIPLLAETGAYREVAQRVLVVDCDELVQAQRAMHRSGLTKEQVRAIMRAQVTRTQRMALADDVIDNSGSLQDLARQVADLDARYRALAQTA